MPAESSSEGAVTLKIPGHTEYVSIARLAVAGLANHLDLSFDDAEDLKLVVTEACGRILREAPGPVDLRLQYGFSNNALAIAVESEARATAASTSGRAEPALHEDPDGEQELGGYLIEALMDEVAIDTDPASGQMSVRMRKRIPAGGPGEV